MHLRAMSVQIQPGKMQEALDNYNGSVLEGARAQKGFQGAYLMTDAGCGKALSITVWESEAGILAGEATRGYYNGQVTKFASIFAGSPSLEHYELSVEASP